VLDFDFRRHRRRRPASAPDLCLASTSLSTASIRAGLHSIARLSAGLSLLPASTLDFYRCQHPRWTSIVASTSSSTARVRWACFIVVILVDRRPA
jgi:hypothetical protein